MFKVTDAPIKPLDIDDGGAGGFVTFEGKVRNRNEGRAVLRLEYEAFGAMAEVEGQRILDEATAMFGLTQALAVHRTGLLEIGATAVWIGVAAPHRAEAFRACEYVIDELKKRVPIWKKEHYADGDSDWIGSQGEGAGEPQLDFYRRQLLLPEIGEEGQRKLAAARVLVVGAGGLGCAALPYLAGAGVGSIGVCDGDAVEVSNLHRQVLFDFADRGRAKADVVAESLRRLNPFVSVRAHAERFTPTSGRSILADYDLVIDGTDNFATKFLLNDLCFALGKPLVQASLHQFDGQILVVDPGSEGGCLRCIWPEAPYDGCVGTCAEDGVLGVVPGVFGMLQANEVLKIILGIPESLAESMLTLDLRTYETHRICRVKRPDCPTCGKGSPERAIDVPLDEALLLALPAIDIREAEEWDVIPGFEDCSRMPLSDLAALHRTALGQGAVLLICEHGVRSAHAARWLREAGIEAYSLLGGADLARRVKARR
jgi:adenylyltransferase/sulfurtransferase